MKTKKTKKAKDKSPEVKIINAARTLFNNNGFANTRIRDIAREAGVNHALIRYYFQDKGKLFENITFQTIAEFFQQLFVVVNDKSTTLEKKIELCTQRCTDKLIENPSMASFVVNEISRRPKFFEEKMQYGNLIKGAFIIKQIEQAIAKGKITAESPRVFLTNLLGLIIFPFLGVPIIQDFLEVNRAEFNKLMTKREKMIPVWIKSMFFN